MQRYLTVPSVRQAKRALWYNCFGIMLIVSLCGYAGMVIFAYYNEEECDPIRSKV